MPLSSAKLVRGRSYEAPLRTGRGFRSVLGGKGMWWRDMSPAMTKLQSGAVAGFTPRERDYIRRELDMFFSTYPRVADGFQL